MYRRGYPYPFVYKQILTNHLLENYLQTPTHPQYLLERLEKVEAPLRIVELGGYNGVQALEVLRRHPQHRWSNYDISFLAGLVTHPELAGYNYNFQLLDEPFYKLHLDMDVFYTSRTLEHFQLREVYKILDATKHAGMQAHHVDWWRKEDTHVIELDSHKRIVDHLEENGYELRNEEVERWSTKLCMVKQ